LFCFDGERKTHTAVVYGDRKSKPKTQNKANKQAGRMKNDTALKQGR
jgi:hypothetical protein